MVIYRGEFLPIRKALDPSSPPHQTTICDLPTQPKLKILSSVAAIVELAALEASINLNKGPPKKQCKNINTIQKEKQQTLGIPLYTTCKKQNKGKNKQQQQSTSPFPISINCRKSCHVLLWMVDDALPSS